MRVLVHDPSFAATSKLPPTVHRVVTGPDAAVLRSTANSLNPWTDTGVHGCLATFGMTDILTFRWNGVSTTLTIHDGGCTGTDFVVGRRVFPTLEDSVLHAQLVRVLGLPAGYTDFW